MINPYTKLFELYYDEKLIQEFKKFLEEDVNMTEDERRIQYMFWVINKKIWKVNDARR